MSCNQTETRIDRQSLPSSEVVPLRRSLQQTLNHDRRIGGA
jgi:hypothetical protein